MPASSAQSVFSIDMLQQSQMNGKACFKAKPSQKILDLYPNI